MSNNDVGSLVSSSSALNTMQSSFDMGNNADVLALLRVAHQNTLDTDVQNNIRDLVFSYQLSHSQEALQKLQAIGADFGISITASASTAASQLVQNDQLSTPAVSSATVHLHVGSGRPTPRFGNPSITPVVPKVVSIKPVSVDAITAQVSKKVTEPSEITSPAYTQAQEPISLPAEEAIVAEPIPEMATDQTATPITSPEVVTPKVADQVTSVVMVSSDDANKRISEIKQLVNAKVGNPVNLIDQNNQVGREYMNALLDAMKKSNGGTQVELSQAMDRLEKALVSVQSLVGGSDGIVAQVIPTPILESIPETQIVEAVETVSHPESVDIASEPVPEISSPIEVVQQPVVGYAAVVEKEVSPVLDDTAEAVTPEAVVATGSEVKTDSLTQVDYVASEVPVPSYALHSVAKDKQLEDLLRAKKVDELQSEQASSAQTVSTDPLQTPEVNAGLAQLLSEWSLFKSSGIFGTGPSGKDHALYLKLASVPMAAIVAGRFDAATPKIKQSITDYMNGWRYEEGVTHEPSETFEHYLRRVIVHILSKRKKSINQ